jgi:hypothetical protein
MDGIQIGSSGGANYLKGMTTRHLIYNLSQMYDGEISNVEQYLSDLYGIPLD